MSCFLKSNKLKYCLLHIAPLDWYYCDFDMQRYAIFTSFLFFLCSRSHIHTYSHFLRFFQTPVEQSYIFTYPKNSREHHIWHSVKIIHFSFLLAKRTKQQQHTKQTNTIISSTKLPVTPLLQKTCFQLGQFLSFVYRTLTEGQSTPIKTGM